jgi:hypothetical protein
LRERERRERHAHKLVAPVLEALDDLSNEVALDAVRLDHLSDSERT